MVSTLENPAVRRGLAVCAALAAPAAARAQVVGGEPGATVRSTGGMVSSEHPEASLAGARVLAQGGNAVDAAIATGFALAVTHPAAGNIGGGGFMVVRFPDGTSTALDFREKAPLAAHPDMWMVDGEYSSRVHHDSHKAVGVPGTVAGFERAHTLYGSTPWHSLVQPAVALASDGFVLSEGLASSLASVIRRHERYPATVAAFSRDGVPYQPGETLRQPDLARTLGRIRDRGAQGFYAGETARLLVEEMERGGGLITLEDLARYAPRERKPVHTTFRGYEVLSMAPPSSGGVAIATMLNILEPFDLAGMGHNSPAYLHHLSEAMRRAFRDRAAHLADPDFVDVPVHSLTSRAHAAELRASIDPRRASVSSPSDVQQATESPETTHYSVVDASGLAVSVTYTLEASYGTGIVVPGAGFLLNNEMGDFNAGPGLTNETGLIGTEPNLARPEQRMLSSMSPSIVAKDGKLVAVVGSPGGRTIINTVFQVILNLTAFGMPLPEAIAAPRIHHQWLPDRIVMEEALAEADPGVVTALEAMGHTVAARGRQGLAHSIWVDPATGELVGQPDPRSPDAAAAGHN